MLILSMNPFPAIHKLNKIQPINYQIMQKALPFIVQKAIIPFAPNQGHNHIKAKTPLNIAVNNLHLYIYDLSYITAI